MDEKNGNLKVFVLDDEPDAVKRLEILLKKIPQIQAVYTSTDPKDALDKIISVKPDLLFVDVEMPGLSGFDVVQYLQEQNQNLSYIFVTAFDQYAIKAIRSAAFDYLLKPVDIDELKCAILRLEEGGTRLQSFKSVRAYEKIRFSTRTGYIYLDPDDVVFCEACGAYTTLHLNDYNKYIVSQNLSRIQNKLPEKSFLRIGRSGLINAKFLHAIDRKSKSITLKIGNETLVLKASMKYLKGLLE